MRMLVTGGRGFIGTAVVAELVARGHEVVVLDSLRADVHDARSAGVVPDGVREVVGDVRDPDVVRSALRGPGALDVVVHLAAKVGLGVGLSDLDDYVASNDLGTAVLLQAMAGYAVPRLVLAGSMVVYGDGAYSCPDDGPRRPGPRAAADLEAGRFDPPCPVCGRVLEPGLTGEDADVDPRNGYAATKLHQEHLAQVFARETGATVASMRFHNVYGPGMPRNTPYAGVASIFLSALAEGRAPQVHEDGAQRRDFVHVGDVARAVATAAETPAYAVAHPFRAYNVGSGRVTTVGEMAGMLARATGGPDPRLTGRYRLGDVRHITASSRRAAAELGWRAEIDLETGLAHLAALTPAGVLREG